MRFLITFRSSYQVIALGRNQAQLISLVASFVALPWLVYLLRRRPAVGPSHRLALNQIQLSLPWW